MHLFTSLLEEAFSEIRGISVGSRKLTYARKSAVRTACRRRPGESVLLYLHRLDDARLRLAPQGWRCLPR